MGYPVEALFNQPLAINSIVEVIGVHKPLAGDVWYRPQEDLVIFTNEPQWDQDELSAEEALDITEEHLSKLQELGMFVVSHATEVVEEPRAMVYCAIPEIPLRDISGVDTVQNSLKRIIDPKLEEQAMRPLSAYISWCTQTRSEFMLANVHNASALRYHHEAMKVYVSDPRPALQSASGANRRVARAAIQDLRSYL